MRKVAFLRIGIDKGCGGILSPIFRNNSFELIWIPEYYNQKNKMGINEERTYSNTKGKFGKYLIDYFPEGANKQKHKDCIIHVDPEFKTFTYGDPSFAKGTLTKYNKGDYIIFYAGLKPYDHVGEDGLYIVGYFEIDKAIKVTQTSHQESIKKEFKNNFHVKHDLIFRRDVSTIKNKGLKLIKGTKNSRLLNVAVKISTKEIYKNIKHPTDILDPKFYDTFGSFNGKVSLRRNPIRWVENDYVEETIKFIKKLK